MEQFVNQAPCIFFSSTDEGILLEVNAYLCSQLEYEAADLVGKKMEVLFTVATRIFQQTHFFPLLKMHGHAEEVYITMRTKSGESLPVLINAERKEIDGKAVSLYVGIVVRNRKKFEDELIAAKKQAETALRENTSLVAAKEQLQAHAEMLDQQLSVINKQNDELRQFYHVVTHDMQEPLRKLSLFSGMLVEEKDEKRSRMLADKIRKVSGQMHSVLGGLQQYVWLSETVVRPEEIDITKLLLSVQSNLNDEFPGVELKVNVQNADNFRGDPDQIRLLFFHILSNAIRFRKHEKEASVNISCDHIQLNQFKNTEGRYNYIDFARIKITDNGVGFDPKYKAQVFELFRRLHSHSGQGVGLSICKKIAENHLGIISIDSAVDEGTTVTIDLPLPK